MFSDTVRNLGGGALWLVLLAACALGACGERIVVGVEPAEAQSDAMLGSADAGGEATPPLARDSEQDSDGDDDEDDEDEDEDDEDDAEASPGNDEDDDSD